MQERDYELELKENFEEFVRTLRAEKRLSKSEVKEVERAYYFAKDAHKHQKRKTGEPYITHPLAVARIVYAEMGLFATSIMAAFLHDVVEDTPVELSEIQKNFGSTVAKIVEGLTKITQVEETTTIQIANYRQILLTISDDIRVILVKLADRLHNMRTLHGQKEQSQLKIASETMYIYAPVANALGFYNIKTELEDIAFSYLAPNQYEEIRRKLNTTKEEAEAYIERFERQIEETIAPTELKFTIKSRFKTVFSIYNKIQTKKVSFDEIKDFYAIRIILEDRPGNELSDCWRTFSFITKHYPYDKTRLRDWLNYPKENGYRSLHLTVYGPEKHMVEIQIRTQSMDREAESGHGAHWVYKNFEDTDIDPNLKEFINNVRAILENPSVTELESLKELREQLKPYNVTVFSPKGQMIKMPNESTALDFAYYIHTDLGNRALSAKINGNLSPLETRLQAGDKIEIIKSTKIVAKEDWLKFVKTYKAKSAVQAAVATQRKVLIEVGKEIFGVGKRWLKIKEDSPEMTEFLRFIKLDTVEDLYYELGKKKENQSSDINISDKLREFLKYKEHNQPIPGVTEEAKPKEEIVLDSDLLVLGKDLMIDKTIIASCCSPVPGDDIVGLQYKSQMVLHRTDCSKAQEIMATFGKQIVKAKFADDRNVEFLTAIKVEGVDGKGILFDILDVISRKMKLNMRKVIIDSENGRFEGLFLVFIRNYEQLQTLMDRLRKEVEHVTSVTRTDSNFMPFV